MLIFFIDQNNNLILQVGTDPNDLGILAPEGIDVQKITIPSEDILSIRHCFHWTRNNIMIQRMLELPLQLLKLDLVEQNPPTVTPPTVQPPSQEISIPDWVRNNAGWWSSGQITDNDFAKGIEFMIKEGIIRVPATSVQATGDSVIPDWVRNNASWWSEGLISDKDFAGGLQYLIENGIISV